MYLLGITGKKGSGKDTVYGIIKELLEVEIKPPLTIERVAFADALKEEVARACGVTVDYVNANKENFRLILQGWGTDFKRKLVRDNYWIERWAKKINNLPDTTYLAVTTDVRYLNEAKIIQECGGKVIRVTRVTQYKFLLEDTHSSETEQDGIHEDFTVINDGGLIDLRQTVSDCLKEIKQNYLNGNKYTDSRDGTKAGTLPTKELLNPS